MLCSAGRGIQRGSERSFCDFSHCRVSSAKGGCRAGISPGTGTGEVSKHGEDRDAQGGVMGTGTEELSKHGEDRDGQGGLMGTGSKSPFQELRALRERICSAE